MIRLCRGVRDVIATVLLSAVLIVIQLVVNMVCMANDFVSMVPVSYTHLDVYQRQGNAQITAASARVLSLGIAIQKFPEGAIISMPLRAEGESKGKAFLGGVLSGVVEPIGAVLTLLLL